MRSIFKQLKDETDILQILNLCDGDPRIALRYVNPAQRALLNRGDWWGTYQVINICVTGNCLTWPREVAAIRELARCNEPFRIRNQWFEFLRDSYGQSEALPNCICRGNQLLDKSSGAAFDEIPSGLIWKLRIFADKESDYGKRILVQGYDVNGDWIRTLDGGNYVDGIYVTLAAPFVDTQIFTTYTGAIKDKTDGLVRIYRCKTDNTEQFAMAIYQPTETVPNYRRSLIPGFASQCCSSGGCGTGVLTAMVKLALVNVVSDNDYLVIGNLEALRLWCQAIKHREDNAVQLAQEAELQAILELNNELRNFTGRDEVAINYNILGTAPLPQLLSAGSYGGYPGY